MNKILTIDKAIEISTNLQKQNKTVVLIGGCFDILHTGHLEFIEHAKKEGNVLMILLESDEGIKKQKGEQRPINTQQKRARMLQALELVDYVIPIPELDSTEYDAIITHIHPNILATTKGDPNRTHKERQAQKIQAQVIDVVDLIKDASTSRLAKLLQEKPL